jgi:tetratricopeptide (TPR) repeat protein/predicted Ser/Thr protein kinase
MSGLKSGLSLTSRFTLLRRLGQGGMADVWLVRDGELGGEVVAKILPPGITDSRVRLLQRECLHARRLSHPNIAPVYDFHRAGEYRFLTMAFVEGDDLGRLRRRSPREILPVVVPIAAALEYAHESGVLHRDLKTDNIVCDPSGRPHLLDFGISALLDEDVQVAGGGSGFNVSPQQLAGEPPATADDIYGFGALLYELISGRPPLWPDVTAERIRSEVPEPVPSDHPVPPRLRDLVAAMLAKSPRERPPSMAAVRTALESIAVAPGTETSVRLTPPPRVRPIRPAAPPPIEVAPRPAGTADRRALLRGVGLTLALIVVGIVVFLVLPRWAERLWGPQPGEQAASEPTGSPGLEAEPQAKPVPLPPPRTGAGVADTPEPDPVRSLQDLRELAYLKQEAEEERDRAVELRGRLEEKNVALWGDADLGIAADRFTQGDRLLQEEDFTGAVTGFGETIRILQSIEGRSVKVLKQALEEGERALAAGDAIAAAAAFDLALAIAPTHAGARTGLSRAEILDELMVILDSGELQERNGDLTAAEQIFSRAAALDPLSRRAQESLARVQARISDDTFARAMSEGLAALDGADWDGATSAFRRADMVRPGTRQVSEGLIQAEEGRKLDTITAHRDRAVGFERSEEWHAAVKEYAAVLDLDPTIRFAQDGKVRGDRRAELSDQLEFHIDNPDRLSSGRVFEEAVALVDEASAVQPSGPRLQGQIETLRNLVVRMESPIRVLLESDNKTEVTVYLVGRLGRFEAHELELRPGTYTVVGSRIGYRDVRLQLVVKPGEVPAPLMVRCKEKI